MTETPVGLVDPTTITTRAEFGRALTDLRAQAGLSIRDVVDRSGALHGTVAGWFSGQHLPTRASAPTFGAVLAACGVTDGQPWLDAAARVRQAGSRRSESSPVPYRGLSAFDEEDAEWFFGREDTTAELVARIRASVAGDAPRVLFVIGPSGAGKSSLLRAGLAAAVDVDDTELVEWTSSVLTPAAAGPDKLAAALAVDRPTVLIVDQFEEFWTIGDDDARADFLDGLAHLSDDIVVVLGLRADFYPLVAREPVLVPVLEAGPVVVGPMSLTELESVVVKPAAKVGVTVPDELVRVLLADLTPRSSRSTGEPGMLPLLSHALLGMWQRADRRTLTVGDYLATGGISGAVQQTAEEVYSELTDDRQRLARSIFLRLVNVDDETQTRRRTPRTELAFADTDTDAVDAIVGRFADARLLTVDENSVQLSHEVLLTAWDRLREWIDADRVGLTVHRGLTRAARVWEDSGRDPTALLGSGRLALFDEWGESGDRQAALNPLERDFLTASTTYRDDAAAAEQRRNTVLRRLVGGLTAASVVALVLAVIATGAGVHARGQSAEAQEARDDAMSRQIATMSAQLRSVDPALAVQLALAGYQVGDTVEARSALLDATAVHAPTRLSGPAGPLVARVGRGGSLVVSAASDGVVRVWTADDGGPATLPVAEFTVDDTAGELYALALSGDGNTVAVGGQGGAWLWDIGDPAAPLRRAVLTPDGEVVYSLEFSPDGTRLVAGTGTGAVLRWNVGDTGAVPLPPLDHPGEGTAFPVFSPDGRWLATAGRESSVRLWDTTHWDQVMTPGFESAPDGSSEHVLAATFSPDGRTLAAGTTGRRVMRWAVDDPAAPAPMPALEGFSSYVNAVAYDSSGSHFAAGSSDNTVKIWSTGSEGAVHTLPGSNPVTATTFVGDGDALVTASLDGTVRWWPLPGPVLPAQNTVYVNPFGADGRLVLFGQGRSGELPLWDVSDAAAPIELPPLRPPGSERFSGAATFSADGTLAAGGTSGGSVHLWDVTDPASRYSGTAESVVEGMVGVVGFAHDAPILAVSATDDTVVALVDVSDPTSPRVAGTFDAGDYPQMMSWNPAAHTLAVATASGGVELWDVTDPSEAEQISTLSGFESQAQAVAFGPDGTVLGAASADRSIRLWNVSDPSSPQELSRITGPADAVYSLHFSPGGDRLAAGVGDGSAWVWDVTDPGRPTTYAALTAYGSRVYDATFGSGGDVLAGGGPDGFVRLWRLDPADASAALCDVVGVPVTPEEWERYLPGVPYRQPCADAP